MPAVLAKKGGKMGKKRKKIVKKQSKQTGIHHSARFSSCRQLVFFPPCAPSAAALRHYSAEALQRRGLRGMLKAKWSDDIEARRTKGRVLKGGGDFKGGDFYEEFHYDI